MTPQEWWWEYDMRVQENERITQMTKGGGKFQGPEWDEARRRHREKMKEQALSVEVAGLSWIFASPVTCQNWRRHHAVPPLLPG